MRITGKLELDRFCEKYTECSYRSSFQEWHDRVKESKWNKPSDVIKTFNSADPNCRTKNGSKICIFNTICGSRLICTINFNKRIVKIQEALTHIEYEKNKWKDRY